VNRGFALTIGLLAALAPAMAHAQTNIDQGKSSGQIFADDCAVCHKSARGLAKGKNSSALASFLREHYTTSREQAAALAAYVLKAPAEEPKPPSSQQAKQSGKPEKQEKPEEGAPATAKLQRPADEEPKSDDIVAPEAEQPRPSATVPGTRAPAGRNDRQPATTARGRRKEREATPAQAASPEIPAIMAEPGSIETPNADTATAPTAAAPAATEPGENAPVPRDDIPD